MKRLLFLGSLLVAGTAGAADFDTIRCAYQEGSSRPVCTVLAVNSTGIVAVVRETAANGESSLYLVSKKSGREYGAVGPARFCGYVSEGGYSCRGPGELLSMQFKTVNGIEVLDVVTTEAKSRQDLCSNYVPLDFNEGALHDGVRWVRESPNLSPQPGSWVFDGDPALRYQEDVPRTALYKAGDYIRVYHYAMVAASPTQQHYRWILTNRFYAPGVTSVRFGTATYTRGSITFSAEVKSGLTQVVEIRSAIGTRVYRVQDPIVLQASGLSEEASLLPNGTVRPYNESKCAEYF